MKTYNGNKKVKIIFGLSNSKNSTNILDYLFKNLNLNLIPSIYIVQANHFRSYDKNKLYDVANSIQKKY